MSPLIDPASDARYQRQYIELHREACKERWRRNKKRVGYKKKRDPIKEKCRQAVRNAVATGKIIKPKNCSKCGLPRLLQAHHKDYAKPFEFEWLCSLCHGIKHRKYQ